MITKRINFLKGQLPGDQAQERMTKEDWDKFYEYVAELKRTGEYLKPDYVDLCYQEDDAFKPTPLHFSNLELFIPQECDEEKIPTVNFFTPSPYEKKDNDKD